MALKCRLTERDKQKKFVQVKLMSFIFKQTSRKATVEIEISEDSKFVRFEFNGYVPGNYYLFILLSRLAGLAPNLKSATLFSVHHSHCMMISQSLKGSGVRKNWHWHPSLEIEASDKSSDVSELAQPDSFAQLCIAIYSYENLT
jgi:hypothetical protein